MYVQEMNIKPWCNCHARGAWQKQDGYRLDRASGLWVHGRCMKPSKMNYERLVLGIDPIPQTSKINDIYEIERFYEALKEISEELSWEKDVDDDDEY